MAIGGVGMIPRSEVGLIVASVGAASTAISPQLLSTVVIMSVLTTFITSPALALLYRRLPDTSHLPLAWEQPDRVLPEM